MGRPPIGKVAMSATERSHRFRAKQRAVQPATKHATSSATASEFGAAEFRSANRAFAVAYTQLGDRFNEVIAELKALNDDAMAYCARIRELEAQIEAERRQFEANL